MAKDLVVEDGFVLALGMAVASPAAARSASVSRYGDMFKLETNKGVAGK